MGSSLAPWVSFWGGGEEERKAPEVTIIHEGDEEIHKDPCFPRCVAYVLEIIIIL